MHASLNEGTHTLGRDSIFTISTPKHQPNEFPSIFWIILTGSLCKMIPQNKTGGPEDGRMLQKCYRSLSEAE